MNTLLYVLLFCSCSVDCVFLFSGSTDKRIRRALLASLSRFQGKEAPLTASGLNSFESAPSQGMNFASRNFPFDLKQKIFEFLDFKHLSIISQVKKSMKNAVKIATERRLSKFHSHFVNEDPLVNNLLYSVLNEHFRSIKSANDPLIHDYLQLLCAKYFFDDLDFSVIPSNIYYYIICFMFEMIYETNLRTPVSIFEFLNDFVCSLRVAEHFLENSYSYVFSKYQEECEIYEDFSKCNHLEFFHSKPSLEAIRLKYDLANIGHLSHEFCVAVMESFISTNMAVEDLFWIYKCFSIPSEERHYSPLLVEIIRSNEALFSLVATSWSRGKYFSLFLEAYKAINDRELSSLSETFDSISPIKPLKFYDALNYDMSELISYNEDGDSDESDGEDDHKNSHLVRLFFSQSYSLSKIDAFSTMISLDQVKLQKCTYFFSAMNHILAVEMLAKESRQTLEKQLIESILFYSHDHVKFLRLLIDILPTNDPFLLLFIPVETLKLLAKTSSLQDKFDLSLHYSLKEGQSCFKFDSGTLGYEMRNHRHFSFKSALSCQDPDVISLFTSNPEEIMDETLWACKISIVKDSIGEICAASQIRQKENFLGLKSWIPNVQTFVYLSIFIHVLIGLCYVCL
jgi:hypothetical protein